MLVFWNIRFKDVKLVSYLEALFFKDNNSYKNIPIIADWKF